MVKATKRRGKRKQRFVPYLIVLLILLIAVLALVLSISGPNLERYIVENPKVQEEIEEFGSGLGDHVRAEVDGNEIVYTFKLNATFGEKDLEDMKPSLEQAMNQAAPAYATFIEDMERDTKLNGIAITIEYLNGDGKEILEHSYKK